ncbi:MAG: 30S ribosome-binding factor RbfA [Bryobacteraceae bacterium]|jgi:ribosome-binding factor A
MDPHRLGRVTETFREELTEIIVYELTDPRLAGIAMGEIHVTPDMRHAHISVLTDASMQEGAIAALVGASDYLRRELAVRTRLFRVPELHFSAEVPGGPAARVEELLRRVQKSRKKSSQDPKIGP